MAVFNNILAGASGATGAAGYEITRSLRFNSADSAYLNRTPSSAGNRRTWTWSGWVKRTKLGVAQFLFNATDHTSTTTVAYFTAVDTLEFYDYQSGGYTTQLITSQVFRDISAWFHLVVVWDTTEATASDRVKIYVNGSQVSTFGTSTYPSQNTQSRWNNNVIHDIGQDNNNNFLDGYLADVHFIDGQALAPTDFGEYDENNVWQPKEYSGTYGTNGFHLPFSDNSSAAALGTDTSGAGNDWTVNNLVAEQPLSLPAVGQTQAGNSYLSVPASDDFNFGTGDFTIEFFLYVIRSGSNNAIFDFRDSGSSAQYFLRLTSSTSCNLRYSGTDLGTFSITSGRWNHVAISRSSGTTKIFVDGTQTNSFSDTNDASNTGPLLFGTFNDTTGSSSSYGFDGQISNLRIVKGTAVYTSAFTTPTAPLTNITNTKLLCCQSSSSATAAAVSPGTITASNSFPTNFSDSTSANDSLVDSPTNGTQADTGVGNEVVGNYATLNPLFSDFFSSAPTYSNGNLDLTQSSDRTTFGTIAVSSGKWYWEISIASGTNQLFGITDTSEVVSGTTTYDKAGSYYYYPAVPRKYVNGSFSSYGSTVSVGDVVGIALDLDSGEITCYKNGVSQGVMASSLPTATYVPGFGAGNTTACTQNINFGQRAFAYTAPSGFKALCTTNLPDPTIADGSDHFATSLWIVPSGGADTTISGLSFAPDWLITKSRSQAYEGSAYDTVRGDDKYFKLFSSTANASESTDTARVNLTSDGFVLESTSDNSNFLANSASVAWGWNAGSTFMPKVYGDAATVSNTAALSTNLLGTASPSPVPQAVQNFDIDFGSNVTSVDIKYTYTSGSNIEYLTSSDGSTWTSHSTNNTQNAGATETISSGTAFRYLRFHSPSGNFNQGLQWINNTNGSITSSVRANASAGFSIVSYTGNGTTNSTIGHGLNAAPEFVIVKRRDNANVWVIAHTSIGTNNLQFDTSAAYSPSTASGGGGISLGNSTTISTVEGTSSSVNSNALNGTYIAYCFAPVAGYSAFGSYTGNGSASGDGPFVFCNFRPRWILTKRTDSTNNWTIIDASRNSYNVSNSALFPNLPAQESTNAEYSFDILSNGFKVRGTPGDSVNVSGGTYIYAAFAENPFKTARAR